MFCMQFLPRTDEESFWEKVVWFLGQNVMFNKEKANIIDSLIGFSDKIPDRICEELFKQRGAIESVLKAVDESNIFDEQYEAAEKFNHLLFEIEARQKDSSTSFSQRLTEISRVTVREIRFLGKHLQCDDYLAVFCRDNNAELRIEALYQLAKMYAQNNQTGNKYTSLLEDVVHDGSDVEVRTILNGLGVKNDSSNCLMGVLKLASQHPSATIRYKADRLQEHHLAMLDK